jgi:hypothetical protein
LLCIAAAPRGAARYQHGEKIGKAGRRTVFARATARFLEPVKPQEQYKSNPHTPCFAATQPQTPIPTDAKLPTWHPNTNDQNQGVHNQVDY